MEPPAVGDDDSEFILSAVSLTRRLHVKFRCHLKNRNPFACPGNAQCCSWTYRGRGGDPTGLHSWEQPPEEPPVLQLDCWKRWGFVGWFLFKCKHLKASLVEAEPSKSENLIIFQLPETSLQQTPKKPPRIKTISSVDHLWLTSTPPRHNKRNHYRIPAFNQSFIKQLSILLHLIKWSATANVSDANSRQELEHQRLQSLVPPPRAPRWSPAPVPLGSLTTSLFLYL